MGGSGRVYIKPTPPGPVAISQLGVRRKKIANCPTTAIATMTTIPTTQKILKKRRNMKGDYTAVALEGGNILLRQNIFRQRHCPSPPHFSFAEKKKT